ncbi:arginyltransferase [Myxococcota bacterium]
MSSETRALRVLPGSPPELVVHDTLSVCPYLRGRTARMPMRLPCRRLRPTELDDRLRAGDRRQGLVLYRTRCPDCAACEPIRLHVAEFHPNRSQRRVLARGDRCLAVDMGSPEADERRVELYNLHKTERGLADGQRPIELESYEDFLVQTCCESLELRYMLDGQLVGVAVADRGRRALNAVYCYYDPRHSQLGLGTYSILKQVELCRRLSLTYLYLGLYVAESRHMAYKGHYLPHERFVNGRWVQFSSCEID